MIISYNTIFLRTVYHIPFIPFIKWIFIVQRTLDMKETGSLWNLHMHFWYWKWWKITKYNHNFLKTKYYKVDLYLSTIDSIFHLLILSFIYIRSISWNKRVDVSFICHPNLHREIKYSGSSCGRKIIMYTRYIPVKGISYIFISLRTLSSEEVESPRGQSIFWGHNTRLEVDIPSNEIEEFHGICLTKI
jgi:hypothetical protein